MEEAECRYYWMLIPGNLEISKLVDLPFDIGGGHGRGGIWEFVDDMDRPAILERELVGLGVDGY